MTEYDNIINDNYKNVPHPRCRDTPDRTRHTTNVDDLYYHHNIKEREIRSRNSSQTKNNSSHKSSMNERTSIMEENNCLKKEIGLLKEAIKEKENMLQEYTDVTERSKDKLGQLDQMNCSLMNKVENMKKQIAALSDKVYKYKDKIHETKGATKSLKIIQEQLNCVEQDYEQKLHEQNEKIKALVEENNMHSLRLKENYDTSRTEFDLLKSNINILERDKEILLREKERDHETIIHLRKLIANTNSPKISKENHLIEKIKRLTITNKQNEEEYMKEILYLHEALNHRDIEIKRLKDNFAKAYHTVLLEKEELDHLNRNIKKYN